MKMLKRFKLRRELRNALRRIRREAVLSTRQGRRKAERDAEKAERKYRTAVSELEIRRC